MKPTCKFSLNIFYSCDIPHGDLLGPDLVCPPVPVGQTLQLAPLQRLSPLLRRLYRG